MCWSILYNISVICAVNWSILHNWQFVTKQCMLKLSWLYHNKASMMKCETWIGRQRSFCSIRIKFPFPMVGWNQSILYWKEFKKKWCFKYLPILVAMLQTPRIRNKKSWAPFYKHTSNLIPACAEKCGMKLLPKLQRLPRWTLGMDDYFIPYFTMM